MEKKRQVLNATEAPQGASVFIVDRGGEIFNRLCAYLSRFWNFYQVNKTLQIRLEESDI
jgi:hypothetical protein